MRSVLIALLLAVPAIASAQTPKDIANQIWPFGAPASTNQAPHEPGVVHGGGSAADLARLAGPRDEQAWRVRAERVETAFVSGFTPADLARLRGDGTAASTVFQAPTAYRIVGR